MSINELKLLTQWVCSRADKKPRDIFGALASPTDSSTWDTYQNCKASSFPNVGFVLADSDPYTIVDLDEPENKEQAARHKKIVKLLDSYTEKSVSGKGLHIIVKGTIPKGVRRDKVEIYSTARYMICTDKPINKKSIEDRQELLDVLYAEMNTTAQVELEQHDALMSDEAVLRMGSGAANSDKFLALCQGDFSEYPSQSEADFALLSIFAFYTRDNEQIKRLFRMSGLGKRKKAGRESYLDTALRKIRAKQPAHVSTETIREAIAAPVVMDETEEEQDNDFSYPPGLVGEVARYITASAIRPVKEVGLGAALALCAGMWGRAFNISGTGLNHYLILLAKTGTGKDGATNGIDSVVNAMRKTLPSVDRFVGPAGFASGQALVRLLDSQPAFVSVLGEFGITLQQISDPRANMAQVMLKRVLLDLYARSGHGKVLRSNVYADAEKNTKMVASPAVTIFGESTPETFYSGIDQDLIAEGLIPRFSVIQYNGPRPARNPDAFFLPPAKMIKALVGVATVAMQMEQSYQVEEVNLSPEAKHLLDDFDTFADKEINKASTDIHAQLWNRAHLKALKFGALLAIGVNHNNPVVDGTAARWAIDFVTHDVTGVLDNFRTGKHGTGNVRQENDLRTAMNDYMKLNQAQRKTYKTPKRLTAEGAVVPFGFMRRRLRPLKAFRMDRRGETNAIRALLDELCASEILLLLPHEQALEEYNTRQALYVRGPQW